MNEGDDVMQETFIRLWFHLANGRPASGGWIYVVARHSAFEAIRKRRRIEAGKRNYFLDNRR